MAVIIHLIILSLLHFVFGFGLPVDQQKTSDKKLPDNQVNDFYSEHVINESLDSDIQVDSIGASATLKEENDESETFGMHGINNQGVASNDDEFGDTAENIKDPIVLKEYFSDDNELVYLSDMNDNDLVGIEEFYEPLDQVDTDSFDNGHFYEPLVYDEPVEVTNEDEYLLYNEYSQDEKFEVPNIFNKEKYDTKVLNKEDFDQTRTGRAFKEKVFEKDQDMEDHGNKKDKKNCIPVERVYYEEKCVPVKEKICRLTHDEDCNISNKKCIPEVKKSTVTECQIVIEDFCKFDTKVYENCENENVTLCDTLQQIEVSETKSRECANFPLLTATKEWQTLEDITCVFGSDIVCNDFEKTYTSKPTNKCYKTQRHVRTKVEKENHVCKELISKTEKIVPVRNCTEVSIPACKEAVIVQCSEKPVEKCTTSVSEHLEVKCTESTKTPYCKFVPKHSCKEESKMHCEMFSKIRTEYICNQDSDFTLYYL